MVYDESELLEEALAVSEFGEESGVGCMRKKTDRHVYVFWALVFAAAFLILGFVGYSDGDDAYFYEYTHKMGFLEYLGWRYETWVGRLAGEAMVYIAFHLGLPFWRLVNALMLTLLPLGILSLAVIAARVPQGAFRDWKRRQPACMGADGSRRRTGLFAAIAVVSGYFMMDVQTVGYAAVWVNGSIFYTWSFTCGIWALTTFAEYVFAKRPAAEGSGGRLGFRMEGCSLWRFLYAIPCAAVASMSIEQMAAVLLVFELLGVIYGICKWRSVHPLLLVQTAVTLLSFAVLFAAPGNDVRVAAEIVNWMPQYETLKFGEHLFLTLHWMISSFANENKLFLCAIWIAGIFLLLQKEKKSRMDCWMIAGAGIFTAVALLPYVGITAFSNLGMQYIDITQRVTEVPALSRFTGMQLTALIWWCAALVYTFFFLQRVSGCQITLLLVYLAGIASEAIMFFSPTMYASGARVYYLTDLLYLFVILCLAFGLKEERRRNILYAVCAGFGVLNFVSQLPAFFAVR